MKLIVAKNAIKITENQKKLFVVAIAVAKKTKNQEF